MESPPFLCFIPKDYIPDDGPSWIVLPSLSVVTSPVTEGHPSPGFPDFSDMFAFLTPPPTTQRRWPFSAMSSHRCSPSPIPPSNTSMTQNLTCNIDPCVTPPTPKTPPAGPTLKSVRAPRLQARPMPDPRPFSPMNPVSNTVFKSCSVCSEEFSPQVLLPTMQARTDEARVPQGSPTPSNSLDVSARTGSRTLECSTPGTDSLNEGPSFYHSGLNSEANSPVRRGGLLPEDDEPPVSLSSEEAPFLATPMFSDCDP
eukprot:Rmarinus@m.18858